MCEDKPIYGKGIVGQIKDNGDTNYNGLTVEKYKETVKKIFDSAAPSVNPVRWFWWNGKYYTYKNQKEFEAIWHKLHKILKHKPMYKLILYEEIGHIKTKLDESTYRYKWLAQLAAIVVLIWAGEHYKKTGIYITTEIEKI